MSAEKPQEDVELSQQVVASRPVSGATASDCSEQQVETSNFLEFDTLVADADAKVVSNQHLFADIGKSCKIIEKSHADIGGIVRQLYGFGIKLNDWSSFEVAKWYLKQGHPQINQETLNKYCCHLRSLLSMHPSKLPDKISISAPVPSCYNPGDEIDVLDTKNHLPPKSFLAMCSLFCAHYCRPHVLCLQSGVE